jgi:hypothetical protein
MPVVSSVHALDCAPWNSPSSVLLLPNLRGARSTVLNFEAQHTYEYFDHTCMLCGYLDLLSLWYLMVLARLV